MGPIFNCKWPFKVLQDLFTPRFVPDPEFKPFDLRALRAEHPRMIENDDSEVPALVTTHGNYGRMATPEA
jgi:hypothetical protein